MAGLTIEFKPFQADGIQDSAEAATWGALTIRVAHSDFGERVLTRVLDRRAQSTRDFVDGTVLPIAEWLTRNWFVLFQSMRHPPSADAPRTRRYRWMRSHCLRYAGEGTAVPNLCIHQASPDTAMLRWRRDSSEDTRWEPVEFLSGNGQAELPLSEVKETISGFVDLVVRRCRELAPTNPRSIDLAKAWEIIWDPNHPDHELGRLAALLQEPLERVPHDLRARLEYWRSKKDPVAEALFECLDLEQIEDLDQAMEMVDERLVAANPVSSELLDLRGRLTPSSEASSWVRGWQDAHELRRILGSDEEAPLRDLPRFEQEHSSAFVNLIDERDALVAWAPGREPQVFAPQRQSRFQRLRNAWSVIYFGSIEKRSGCVLSPHLGGLTPVANAFATELLAPKKAVRRLVQSRPRVDGDDVQEIANSLNAPWQCVRHQIENHRFAELDL